MSKSQSILLLFLLLLALALVAAYQVFLVKEEYPISRMITNRDGKSLEVMIVGRKGDTIYFDRVSDGRRFELPLAELERKDQWLAFRYPEQSPPPVVESEGAGEEEKQMSDPYIATRLRRIKALKEEQVLYTKELASGTLSSILQRSRGEKLLSIEKEIRELEVSIETYKWRTRN